MLSRRRIYQARQRYLPYLFAAAGAILALNLVGYCVSNLSRYSLCSMLTSAFPDTQHSKYPL